LPGAREHFTSALAGYEAIRPPGDLACLRLRVNLASVLAQIGEREAARAELGRVLDEGGRSLPAGHPELLRAQLNLATLVYDLGDSGLARETYERVLVELTRTLPADHPDVLSARLNLAIVLGDLGEREECLERLTGVLADYEPSWPRSDRKLLLARFSLFLALASADRVDEAHHELAEFVEGLIDRSVACFGLASREASEALAKDASWLQSVLLVGSGAGRELETRIFDLI
jgi:tetratricopeptide (TPR) repeat protein